MQKTLIEWVRNPDGSQGYTFNPITGCLNRTPDGLCKGGGFPCYAYRLANGRLKERYLANTKLAVGAKGGVSRLTIGGQTAIEREGDYADPFYPRFWPDRLEQPIYQTKPSGIFTVDMGELFGDWIPLEWQANIFEVIDRCPQHRFYLLTKQPQNLIKFSPFPDNCWVGVTVTNQIMLVDALIHLYHIKAKVKYISFEPLINQIRVMPKAIDFVNWLIIGAQTKPYKPPEIEWVKEIIEAADRAGIPVFLKDNLKPLFKSTTEPSWMVGWNNKPDELRQEMPR